MAVKGNEYTVENENNKYILKARGVLKIKSSGIVCGDEVEFDEDRIIKVLERKNYFIRPNVANVDVVVIVLATVPAPDFMLIDKILIGALSQEVECILVVNKADLGQDILEKVKAEYKGSKVPILSVSTLTGEGIDALKSHLKNKVACLFGQSAVGKTSICNAVFGLDLKVGDLSAKIQRGKQTTTGAQIIKKGEYSFMDTAGFHKLLAFVDENDLKYVYPEFYEYNGNCYFNECNHIFEPSCEVKNAVLRGEISSGRYSRYKEIFEEIKQNKRY